MADGHAGSQGTSESATKGQDGERLSCRCRVGDYPGVKAYTTDGWVSPRRIPYLKLGGSVGFSVNEIEAWKERLGDGIVVAVAGFRSCYGCIRVP